jgi:peptidoglycan DL-endopeptidase CwlO
VTVRNRLAPLHLSLAPLGSFLTPGRARAAAPVALVVAGVMTFVTGASAATVRHGGPTHVHRSSAAAAHLAGLALPSAPAASAVPASADSSSSEVVSDSVTAVPRPKHLIDATLLVTGPRTLSLRQLRAIKHIDGVRVVQTVAAGATVVDGHRAFVLGVDPNRFRAWTPRLTAASQPLWQSIAAGELTASFDMGHDAKLPLGATVPVRAAFETPIRIGAFASVGMAGVDAIVSGERAQELGLPAGSGILVSAPKADAAALRNAVRAVVGRHARAWLLRQLIVIRDAGEFMTRLQINTILRAAAGRIGVPYVWGATGPNSFDCSGLVQWAFAHAGIRMPRVSQQQWFAGPHVPYSAARPGDLLFWHYDPTDPANVDHVALYAGNGMMIVAPHTGDYVKYVAVPLANLAGVVRVDPRTAAAVGW